MLEDGSWIRLVPIWRLEARSRKLDLACAIRLAGAACGCRRLKSPLQAIERRSHLPSMWRRDFSLAGSREHGLCFQCLRGKWEVCSTLDMVVIASNAVTHLPYPMGHLLAISQIPASSYRMVYDL